MIDLKSNVNCCGCTACSSICPVGAITMTVDEEGFSYPKVDEEVCIHCCQCIKVCTFRKDQREAKNIEMLDYIKSYAVKHKNQNIRMASRSGGVFSAVSDTIFSHGGVVYGCIMTEDLSAKHVRSETRVTRDLMRGSKYVQSELSDTFVRIKEDLIASRYVLFSGTGCQVAALKSYLGKEYKKLFLIDIVCHGVPSSLVFRKYIGWQEKIHKGRCKHVDFRNKEDFGWSAHVETLSINVDETYKKVHSQVYKTMFLNGNILRPSCFECPYKSINRRGDITIGDFWGIEKAAPGFNDNKGVSLVLINNDKGNKMLHLSSDGIEIQECRIEDSIQPALIGSKAPPVERVRFWQDLRHRSFGLVARKYGGYGKIGWMVEIGKKGKRKLGKVMT